MTSKTAFAILLIGGLAAWFPAAANPYLSTPYALAAQAMDPEEPVVPAELVESIRADLELIDVVFPGASSWWATAPFVPGYMVLYLTDEGVESWESGTFSELEALLDQYEGEVTGFRKWESLGGGYVDINFAGPLNTPLLFPVFDELNGVDYASVNGFIGDGDRAYYIPESGLYIFRHGYGDCPSGCINQDVYYFQVKDGTVTQLDLETAITLSGFSINPVAETVTGDTHEPVTIGNGIQAPGALAWANASWIYSETSDFEAFEYVPYDNFGEKGVLQIPFVRLSDAGYYKATYSIRATGFSFVGPVIQLVVTDTEPTDPDAVANIEDPGLRAFILDRLQIAEPPIAKRELAELKSIYLDEWLPEPVTSLEGIQDANNVSYIHIGRNAVTDLSPLASLPDLRILTLEADGRTERLELSVAPLTGLTELKAVDLNFYSIQDLPNLAEIQALEDLRLNNCGITHIQDLIPTDLVTLELNWNPIEDVESLLNFPNLYRVELIDTPIDFSEDSPHKAVLDELRERGVNVFPAESRLPRLWSTETWIPASGGRGFFWMRPGIAHNQVYHDADWLTMLGNGDPYEKVRFEVVPNPDPEPRSVRLVVHNLAHTVHQLGNSGPWRNAIPVGEDGWRRSDWLGFILPGEDGWVWHPEHGWLSVVGESDDDLWVYDPAMECWLWTSATLYPFLYRNDEAPGWLLYLKGAAPGERWFYDVASGSFVHEG
jgi:hypothetical protein